MSDSSLAEQTEGLSLNTGGLTLPNHTSAAIEKVRSFLGKRILLEVADGRIFEGALSCFDKDKNLILYDSSETRNIHLPGIERAYTKME